MAHVKIVLRKCGGFSNNFVCNQISDNKSFISRGLRILKARTDFVVFCEMALIFSFSFNVFIYTKKKKIENKLVYFIRIIKNEI